MLREFELPQVVRELVAARNNLRRHYALCGLTFTIDGNLVGDLGEAVAAELFDIQLVARNGTGIDGFASDGRSVQVKATGTGRGPAFRVVDRRADHLLFLDLDLENLKGRIVFNGPEVLVIGRLPPTWVGQRALSLAQIAAIDRMVRAEDRLLLRNASPSHETDAATPSTAAE
jgi:hypothetical protein